MITQDSAERKQIPLYSGFVAYFTNALAGIPESSTKVFTWGGVELEEASLWDQLTDCEYSIDALACAWVSSLALLEAALGGELYEDQIVLDSVSAVLDRFPRACCAVAKLSWFGNNKHNPGEPLHWSRAKSSDHPDCFARHWLERYTIDPASGQLHLVEACWRLGAWLQTEIERERGLPPSRGSR